LTSKFFLIVDIGNTRVKVAVFRGDVLVSLEISFKRYTYKILKKHLDSSDVSAAILSNTSEVDGSVLSLFSALPCFIHLDHLTRIPIALNYETPHTLGRDRIAAAIGAVKRYPSKPVLFIDMGTCITMNFVNSKSEFEGGNISPGISMRLKAMHKFTARLPHAPIMVPEEFFGKNTVKGLQNGAVKGTIREIDTFIDETRSKFGAINVILTGGDALLFEKYTKNQIFVAPNLVLEGLNEILRYNVDKN
jgi:type III pantothenate kinase